MRYRKGSKVEVRRRNDFPSRAWRSAEILGGNGCNYCVRYDYTHEIDRVSRNTIRPCPPPDLLEDLAPGNVVEIFENFSWKMAKIFKCFGENRFLVRLLESSLEFVVNKDNIRTTQAWKNNEWVVIGKDFRRRESRNYDESSAVEHLEANIGTPSRRKRLRISINVKTSQIHLKDEENVNASSSRTRKRSFDHLHAYVGGPKNIRAGNAIQVRPAYASVPPELPEKPDSFATTGYLELDSDNGKEYDNVRFRSVENQQSAEAESTGSCSIGESYSHSMSRPGSMGSYETTDDYSSNAESFKEEEEAEIHRLELHAYHSIIVAFHALGPLSWEKETLISNLRRHLNISNDEHLTEIKTLLTSGNKISIR